jgi:hypothetical protein
VSDAAHHGHRTGGDRPRHHLRVEGLQIFERPAAAHEQHHLDVRAGAGSRQSLGHFVLGSESLHARRHDQQTLTRQPAPGHRQHVAQRGARGGRHDRDAFRQRRQLPLARGIEQALGVELPTQLLEGELERPDTLGLELADHELQLAARLVHREVAIGEHLHPLFGLEGHASGSALEHGGAKLTAVVLQREVDVPRAGSRQVADLADDPDSPHAIVEQLLQAGDHVAHREHARTGCGLGHRPTVSQARSDPARRLAPASAYGSAVGSGAASIARACIEGSTPGRRRSK